MSAGLLDHLEKWGEIALSRLFPDRAHVFPPGEQVTFMTGPSNNTRPSTQHEERMVVSGVVQASQVREDPHRKDFRWWVEILLSDMTVFRRGDPLEELENLRPQARSLFRIGLPERYTVGWLRHLLRGQTHRPDRRNKVVAYEVPWKQCPKCNSRAGKNHRFCRACGQRLHVLYGPSLPEHRGQKEGPTSEICSNCWMSLQPGRFCKHCGFDHQIEDELQAWADRSQTETMELVLVARQRRTGTLQARITDLAAEKIDPDLPAQMVATLQDIQLQQPATDWLQPPDEKTFSTQVLLGHDWREWKQTLHNLEQGHRERATEFKQTCNACSHRSPEEKPWITGFFCSECGTRQRLSRHPSWGEHIEPVPEGNIPVHDCGFSYDPALDRFCSMCGQSLAEFDPGPSRLGGLWEETA